LQTSGGVSHVPLEVQTGQDWTGQDRKGKERKGQERKGKENLISR